MVLLQTGLVGCHPQIIEDETPPALAQDLEFSEASKDAMGDAASLVAQDRTVEAGRAYRALSENGGPLVKVAASILAAELDCRAGHHGPALETLRAIADDLDNPLALRRGALGYFALCAVRAKDRAAALAELRDYPGQEPSPLWLEGDRAPVLWLLAQARRAQRQPMQALEVLSWIYEFSGTDEARLTARRWALDLLRELASPEELETAAGAADDFTRGMAGAAFLLEALAGKGQDGAFEGLMQLHSEISPSLVRLDEGALVGDLSRRLSETIGPRAVRFGVLLPLTGRDRRAGAVALSGVLMAQEAFRLDLGPRSTLVIEDTGSTPEGARRGLRSLAEMGVLAVIGPLDNSEARAAAQVAQEAQVPLIALNQDKSITSTGAWVFRHFLDSQREVRALVGRAANVGVTRLGILHPELSFGREQVRLARDEAKAVGVEVVVLGYDPGATDFSAPARQLRRAKVGAVYIPDVARRVGRLLPFLAAEGMWCSPRESGSEGEEQRELLCLGGTTWYQPDLLKFGGKYVEGALVVSAYAIERDTEANRVFMAGHHRHKGGHPDFFTAFAFESVKVVRQLALSRRLGDRASVGKALGGLRGFEGLMGEVSADAQGELAGALVLVRVRGGQFVIETVEAP